MSVDAWKSIFDTGTVIAAFLVFVFGAGGWITGNIVNKRQAAQLRLFDKDLIDAKERVANAELRTAELLTQIQPRDLDKRQREEIEITMRPFSGDNLLIASQWIDSEAARLAKEIKTSLNKAGVGTGNTFTTTTVDKIGKYPEIVTGLWGGGGGTAGVPIIRTGIEIWGSDRSAVMALASTLGNSPWVTTPPQSENPYANGTPPEYASMSLIVFVGSKPIPDVK